jgi:hypothetical protein
MIKILIRDDFEAFRKAGVQHRAEIDADLIKFMDMGALQRLISDDLRTTEPGRLAGSQRT